MKNRILMSPLIGISIIVGGCISNQEKYYSLGKFEQIVASYAPKTTEEKRKLQNVVFNLNLSDIDEQEKEFLRERYQNQNCPKILENERTVMKIYGLNYKCPSKQEMLYLHRISKAIADVRGTQ